jgi:uncharacterized membrane protein YedE/YeeE
MTDFTPLAGAAGGLLIGLSAVFLMGGLGRIAGISGIFRAMFTDVAGWQAIFLLGLLAGTALTVLAACSSVLEPRWVPAAPRAMASAAWRVCRSGASSQLWCSWWWRLPSSSSCAM